VLFLSALSTRFFRITRSHVFGLDQTHIHFGTPSKMSIVFSNLGTLMLFQDIPQLFVQVYIWLIWRNAGPRISLLCFILGAQSIFTAALHHIFSRAQRAAYERVVKLLGVRRLTAGFFDINSGNGPMNLAQLADMRKAEDTGAQIAIREDDMDMQVDDRVDPAKLDPIQAAIYVSQMYEKEARLARESHHDHSLAEEQEEDLPEELPVDGEGFFRAESDVSDD